MTDYEQNAEAFERIIAWAGGNLDPELTEADTRVKLIDRILHEALGWSEHGPHIRREEHVHEGYIDYTMQADSNFLIMEAKRVGQTFLLPAQFKFESHLTVKNLLSKQTDIRLMYNQVVRYAHERGIACCSLTNGTQWLVFPGVRTDNIHIRHSRVILFNGLESIRDNFLDFWRLLSFESVRAGNLQHELAINQSPIEPTFQFNAEGRVNIPYDRNPLALPLVDILPRYFGDLQGDPYQTDMLKECFVLNDPAQEALTELGSETGEEKPSKRLTAIAPVMHFYSLPLVAEKLDALIESFVADQRAQYLQVLLGRVGIGKTTFLLYFLNIHKKDLAEKHFTLYLDFRDVSESTDIESFFTTAMWNMLSQHPRFSALTSTSTLQSIFKHDIGILERGPLERLKLKKPEEYEDEIARFLSRQFVDRSFFLKRLADFLYQGKWARFILVFDNVDQLSLDLQEKVIRFAWAKATEFKAFLILSMWEETYFSSKRGSRVLSTIRTVPLQIARQSIGSVLIKRLQYLIKQISEGKEPLTLLNENICDKKTFCRFLDLILRSLLVDNKRVRMFLELVALGNIRRALEMFHSFLTAGSLETGKILEIMRKSNEYLVPEHEFIKSVMLGSKRFYSENTSDIANLFSIGDIEKPSHFTRLRILQWLYERRHESTHFGLGFRTIDSMVTYFNSIGVSRKDVISSIRRLTESALIENDLRALRLIDDAQAVRITPSGRYYLTYLHRQFPYIDLVMQDTPFFDREVFDEIEPLCEATDMQARFRRCERFLDYIQDQEEEEMVTIEKLGRDVTWRRRFTLYMRITYEGTKQFIINKGY